MDDDFTRHAALLIDKLNVEHKEWQSSLEYGHTMDTLVFWIDG